MIGILINLLLCILAVFIYGIFKSNTDTLVLAAIILVLVYALTSQDPILLITAGLFVIGAGLFRKNKGA